MKQTRDSAFFQSVPETGADLEAKRIQLDDTFSSYVREKLLGTEKTPGLLERIDDVHTEPAEQIVSKELTSLLITSGLTFLSGHTAAAFEGVAGFRSGLMRLEPALQELYPHIGKPSYTLEKEAASCIEFVGRLAAIHPDADTIGQAVPDLPLETIKRVEAPDQIDKFGFIGQRVLKARIQSYLAEKNMSHLLEENAELIAGVETNDLSAAVGSEFEVDDEYGIFNKLTCDETLKARLLKEYIALAGEWVEEFTREGGLAAELITLRATFSSLDQQLARPDEYKAYLKKYADFETRWLCLRLALAHYTPIA